MKDSSRQLHSDATNTHSSHQRPKGKEKLVEERMRKFVTMTRTEQNDDKKFKNSGKVVEVSLGLPERF